MQPGGLAISGSGRRRSRTRLLQPPEKILAGMPTFGGFDLAQRSRVLPSCPAPPGRLHCSVELMFIAWALGRHHQQLALQIDYVSLPGNFTTAPTLPVQRTVQAWPFVTEVDVDTAAPAIGTLGWRRDDDDRSSAQDDPGSSGHVLSPYSEQLSDGRDHDEEGSNRFLCRSISCLESKSV